MHYLVVGSLLNVVDHPLLTYVSRLRARGDLDDADREAFLSLPAQVTIHEHGTELVAQGDSIHSCILLIDGFISRTKIMKNKHQIVAFCIAGDAVDLQSLSFDYADHTLETHAASTIATVRHSDIEKLMSTRPRIMRVLWREALSEAAIFREWAANVGGRSARQRIAHLLLEMDLRYQSGMRSGSRAFSLPVTQSSLASATGLSLVHLNKSLRWLSNEGFLTVQGRIYEILRRDELIAFCDFDPTYLHLWSAEKAAQFEKPGFATV